MSRGRRTDQNENVTASVPRITSLKVQNYRALKSIEIKDLTPMTVLLGPNGSGKSTVFDVFNFLSECFQFGLRHAWDHRLRAGELKTRGGDGPLVIELKYLERPKTPLITYHLAIDEEQNRPVVQEEWLQWTRGGAASRSGSSIIKEGAEGLSGAKSLTHKPPVSRCL